MTTLFIVIIVAALLFAVAYGGLIIRDIEQELYHQRLLISRIYADIQRMQKAPEAN